MSFSINVQVLIERAALRAASAATVATLRPEPHVQGRRVATVATDVDDSAPTLRDDLRAAIDGATRERGDSPWNVQALHDECAHLSNAHQLDLIEHFAEVERIWRRANAGMPPESPP